MADQTIVLNALKEYSGDTESLNKFRAIVQKELGDNWVGTIYTFLPQLEKEDKDKLDHAVGYHSATLAWEEAHQYLNYQGVLDLRIMQERLPILKHWLGFFGKEGTSVFSALEKRIASENKTSPVDYFLEKPQTLPLEDRSFSQIDTSLPKEEALQLWLADKIFIQIEFMNQINSWISARCYTLGGIELNEYSFYGFLSDVQRQTLLDIRLLLEKKDLYPLLIQKRQDALEYLKTQEAVLEQDLQKSTSPVPLTKEQLTKEEMQRTLGGIDNTDTKEYLGPAPDGFEVVDDLPEEQVQKITQEYEKVEAEIESQSSQEELSPERTIEKQNLGSGDGLRDMLLNINPEGVS